MREWFKRNHNIVAIIIALAGSISLNESLSFKTETTAYSNSFLSVLLFALSAAALIQIFHKLNFKDKRGGYCSLLFSALLSFSLVVGKQLHTVENCNFIKVSLWINIIILTIYIRFFIWFLLQYFQKNSIQIQKEKDPWNWKAFFLTWIMIFVLWIPVFMAFYPGAFVYDAQDEYEEVVERVFTTHHPLVHVLLLGGAVCFGHKYLGSFNIGIAIYTIFQMTIMSGILSYSIQWVCSRISTSGKTKKLIKGSLILFYAFFPIFPMYAVCSAKDSLFNALLFLTVILMSELFLQSGQGKVSLWTEIFFVITAGSMLLFRRNAVYAFLPCIAILLISYLILKKKENIKRILFCMCLAFLFYFGINTSVEKIFHASNEENQELYTVAIQQMARTYKYSPEVFSEKEKEILYQYIAEDILKIYDADLSDLVKAHFNNELFSKDKTEFLGLWFKTGMKKPFSYLNAWLMTSYGYWYPDTIINVYGGQDRFTFRYEDSSYFGFETELPGVRDSKFPWLEEQYRKISLEIYQQKLPVLSMLFSPGFMFWVFAFTVLTIIYKKNYRFLLAFGMVLLIWLTFLLGPTFLVRYVLILWFLLPVNLLMLLGRTNDFS